MSIDDNSSYSEGIYNYDSYIKDTIADAKGKCDELIELLLFYKFILNSEYDSNDLNDGTVAENINQIFKELKDLKNKSFSVKGLSDYILSEDIELKWKDFKKGNPTKEVLRNYKIYKLTKKD